MGIGTREGRNTNLMQTALLYSKIYLPKSHLDLCMSSGHIQKDILGKELSGETVTPRGCYSGWEGNWVRCWRRSCTWADSFPQEKKKKGTGLGRAGKLVYSCVGACTFCGGYLKVPGLCQCYLIEKERHLSTSSTASRQSTVPACGGRELLSPVSKRCLWTWKRDISGDTGNHHP